MEKNNLIQVLQDWELLLSEISRNGTALDNDALDVLNETIRAALTPVDVEGLKREVLEAQGLYLGEAMSMGDTLKKKAVLAAIDHLAARGFGVPEGYALVPIEPTDEILNAIAEQCDGYNENYYFDIYKAMIKAAPKKEGM